MNKKITEKNNFDLKNISKEDITWLENFGNLQPDIRKKMINDLEEKIKYATQLLNKK